MAPSRLKVSWTQARARSRSSTGTRTVSLAIVLISWEMMICILSRHPTTTAHLRFPHLSAAPHTSRFSFHSLLVCRCYASIFGLSFPIYVLGEFFGLSLYHPTFVYACGGPRRPLSSLPLLLSNQRTCVHVSIANSPSVCLPIVCTCPASRSCFIIITLSCSLSYGVSMRTNIASR